MIRKPIGELASVVWGSVSELVRTQGIVGSSCFSFPDSSSVFAGANGGVWAFGGASCEEELSLARGGFTNL